MRLLLCLWLLLLPVGAEVSREHAFRALESAPTAELYSLQPGEFDGATSLGKALLRGWEKRQLVAALEAGVAESDGSAAKCFRPRHALVVRSGNEAYAFVVCFECLKIFIFPLKGRFDPGHLPAESLRVLTTDSPADVFNAALRRHRIPLSPK